MFNFFKKKEVPIVEKKLKPANETQEYAKRASVSRETVLNKINEAARGHCSYASITGSLTEELKKELTDAGYAVREYRSDLGYYCTKIYWE